MISGSRLIVNVFGFLWLSTSSIIAAQQFPVIDAVDRGHAVGREQDGVEAVRTALLSGGDVNERDAHGWTPLMEAALQCRAKVVKFLLDQGANVNLRGNSGGHSFADSGHTALLLASGCFIARRRAQLAPERHMPEGYASYELAAPVEMVRELLTRGADPAVADADGRTPLMMAAMQGWRDVVKELLNAHAAVSSRDHEGRLAIDYAAPTDKDIIALLKKAASPKPSGKSGRTVCDAQQALNNTGFDLPIRDCIAGQRLGEAVRKFQQDHSLNVSGNLDIPTLNALGVRQ